MSTLFGMSQDLIWRSVPQQAVALAEKCAATTKEIRKVIKDLPQDGFLDLWYNKDLDRLLLNVGDWMESDVCEQWTTSLEPLADSVRTEAEIGGPSVGGEEGTWVKVAYRPLVARAFLEKQSVSPTLSTLAKGLGYRPGVIPGAPSPLIAGLSSGLLGAGLGYGAGWLGEQLLPQKWKRGNLSRTLAILGGLGGMVPAGLWMANNVRQGKPFYSGEAMQTPQYDFSYAPEAMKTEFGVNPYPDVVPGINKAGVIKEADYPTIDVAQFRDSLWDDERIANRLPLATRAAASGLVEGAAAIRGRNTRFITPMDIARLTAGMGSGYLSGALVGKALGALVGMPQQTQERLRNTGLWAGVVANMIPIAFGIG